MTWDYMAIQRYCDQVYACKGFSRWQRIHSAELAMSVGCPMVFVGVHNWAGHPGQCRLP